MSSETISSGENFALSLSRHTRRGPESNLFNFTQRGPNRDDWGPRPISSYLDVVRVSGKVFSWAAPGLILGVFRRVCGWGLDRIRGEKPIWKLIPLENRRLIILGCLQNFNRNETYMIKKVFDIFNPKYCNLSPPCQWAVFKFCFMQHDWLKHFIRRNRSFVHYFVCLIAIVYSMKLFSRWLHFRLCKKSLTTFLF